jgi:hypothetical protein
MNNGYDLEQSASEWCLYTKYEAESRNAKQNHMMQYKPMNTKGLTAEFL